MTSYADKGEQPKVGKYLGFHHCEFWVSNALQAAEWYALKFGYKLILYKGLETGSREVVSYVLRMEGVTLVMSSPLNPGNKEMGDHIVRHGDGVKDVAFQVIDTDGIYQRAIENGAKSVRAPYTLKDKDGEVRLASVQTYGDTIHTFVDRSGYKGAFLPGYEVMESRINDLNGDAHDLLYIDHIVGNQDYNEMESVVEWYVKTLKFHRFWSVDDTMLHTDYSALNSVVVTDYDEKVKLPINEPAVGKRKSQIAEYVEYYGGAGVQHIALRTNSIIDTVERLAAAGVKFLTIPSSYYDMLKERLAADGMDIKEDMEALQRNHILVDYDKEGYLLQIFTEPAQDRPTLFYEVIQRHNNNGFGAGNFKALFRAIEIAQEKRGNLN